MTKQKHPVTGAGERQSWNLYAGLRLPAGFGLAVTAGFLLRIFFVVRYAHIVGDSLVYGDIARNLIQHGVYGFSTGGAGHAVPMPTLIRLPGYPLFLAVCFLVFGVEHYTAVMLVQAVLDLVTIWLCAAVASRLFGVRAGLATLWLGMMCPFVANYVASPLTETLSLLCIALAFYGLVRWQGHAAGQSRSFAWLLVIGFALAYALLLRPEQGLLAAAVVPAVFLMSRQSMARGLDALKPALLVSLLTVLPLVPWTVRNWETFHVLQPIAPRFATDPGEINPSGFQRWYRTWAVDFASTENVYWNYDSAAIQIADLPNRAFDSNEQYEQTEALLNEYNETTTATEALDTRFSSLADERIRASPSRYFIAMPIARVLNMCFRPRVENLPVPLEWWRLRNHPRAAAFAFIYGAINLAYFGLAVITAMRWKDWGRSKPVVLAMLATVCLRLSMLLVLDNSEPRYTLEFFPVLIVLAGPAVVRLLPRRSQGVTRQS